MEPSQTGYAMVYMPSGYHVRVNNLYGQQLTLGTYQTTILPNDEGWVILDNEWLKPERVEFIPSPPVTVGAAGIDAAHAVGPIKTDGKGVVQGGNKAA